jgi:MerR family transcriptional regulator, thiopeptide resistance regulator
MPYTVGEVARTAHVSVRTLHHYDELGLLVPSGRSGAGYRLYDDADLERLQQILFYRELGLPLDEIARIMADPAFDRTEALLAQREALRAQVIRAEALLDAVERALSATRTGVAMTKEEMFEVFGDDDPTQYEDEVKERWGDTEAYRVSMERTKRYTKEDWKDVKAETDQMFADFTRVFTEGHAPGDPEVQEVVERHRLSIDQRFYPCSKEMHAGLGRMYVADPRFKKNYDKHAEGLAQFVCDATQIAAGLPVDGA